VSTSQPTAPASTYHYEAPAGVLVATAPGPTAAEPPRVLALRVSVAAPLPVATAELGRLAAVAPRTVATLLFLIMLLQASPLCDASL
jgi:hypothetical protein